MILFYYLSGDPDDYPLDINQTGFNMLENYYKVTRNRKLNVILFFIYFFLNGINYFINILAIKLTNTLYRCSMFGINTILSLLSMAFGQAINYQIQNYFFLIGGLNTIGIISEFYSIRINSVYEEIKHNNILLKKDKDFMKAYFENKKMKLSNKNRQAVTIMSNSLSRINEIDITKKLKRIHGMHIPEKYVKFFTAKLIKVPFLALKCSQKCV